MKMSIRKRLTITFLSLTVILFLLLYLANNFFLDDYYSVRKREVLVRAYTHLNTNIQADGSMDDSKVQEIEDLCNANNISFVVTDDNYNLVIWTAEGNGASDYARLMLGRLNGYGIGLDVIDEKSGDDSILVQNEQYTIQEKYDPAVETDYLEMWGLLDQGFHFIMRINMESIRESAQISSRFSAYICLLGILIGGILVWVISKRITQPIHELTELSTRMAALDFEAKYTNGGSDEVGQLGEHFNQMSEKLEKVYSQLLTANNELKKDIEKKEQIDDMRKEFLSNVSHELKTPIALIQGYAEGLQECVNEDAESREFYCDVIMDEAIKMNALVQKLLTLNQLEFGNDQVILERFNLSQLIRNKVQSILILAQQKNAELKCEIPDNIYAWGDEFKVEEVLTNYLSNALNHVDGSREIIVSAEFLDDRIRICVYNTGKQIPTEDISLIWDKFYKVDKARTREYGGSGVGLSIVKAIMDSFHQAYGVQNKEYGVEFWFELKNGNCPDIDKKEMTVETGMIEKELKHE